MTLRFQKAVVLTLSIAGAVILCGASDAKKEFVTLPAIKVYGSWINVHYFQGENGRITRVVIQEVTPNSPAARSGLRRGDELIAIDDAEVIGMSDEQFAAAYTKDLPSNGHRDYDFRCYRGFFGKRERLVRFRLTSESTEAVSESGRSGQSLK